jgi:hypothetical protein
MARGLSFPLQEGREGRLLHFLPAHPLETGLYRQQESNSPVYTAGLPYPLRHSNFFIESPAFSIVYLNSSGAFFIGTTAKRPISAIPACWQAGLEFFLSSERLSIPCYNKNEKWRVYVISPDTDAS